MAAALYPLAGPTEAPPRKRFTRREFDRLSDLGAFEGQRFELIDGDLIDKMGQNTPHVWAIAVLMQYLTNLFGLNRVRCQAPIEVADKDREFNYPEPDLTVLAKAPMECPVRHPHGEEITLLVEVANTTARFDQIVKSGLYARAGVPEYWVLDITNRIIYLYRHPVNGRYTQVLNAADGETVASESMPEATVPVSGLLPSLPVRN